MLNPFKGLSCGEATIFSFRAVGKRSVINKHVNCRKIMNIKQETLTNWLQKKKTQYVMCMQDMGADRVGSAAAMIDRCLYVAGGCTDRDGVSVHSHAEKLHVDEGSPKWESMPSIIKPRAHAACAVVGSKLSKFQQLVKFA